MYVLARPRLARDQSRSTTLVKLGRLVLRVALRGVVSGRLLARRWPHTHDSGRSGRFGTSLRQGSAAGTASSSRPALASGQLDAGAYGQQHAADSLCASEGALPGPVPPPRQGSVRNATAPRMPGNAAHGVIVRGREAVQRFEARLDDSGTGRPPGGGGTVDGQRRRAAPLGVDLPRRPAARHLIKRLACPPVRNGRHQPWEGPGSCGWSRLGGCCCLIGTAAAAADCSPKR